jgi:hypothetical protein
MLFSFQYEVLSQKERINQTNRQDLRIGKWVFLSYADWFSVHFSNIYLRNDENYSYSGNYKIIKLDNPEKYNSYKKYRFEYQNDNSPNNELRFYFSSKKGKKFSVKNGIWFRYQNYFGQKIIGTEKWENGYLLEENEFKNDTLYKTTRHYLKDQCRIKDIIMAPDSFVYQRYIYRNNLSKNPVIFYPASKLKLEPYSLWMSAQIGGFSSTNLKLENTSNDTIKICRISFSSNQFRAVSNEGINLNDFDIEPQALKNIKLIFSPIRHEIKDYDTVFVHTNQTNPSMLKVIIKTSANDFTRSNIRNISQINIQKIKGKPCYIYACDVGWHTWGYLFKDNTIVKKFMIGECDCRKVYISDLNAGIYRLQLESDGLQYNIRLVIAE